MTELVSSRTTLTVSIDYELFYEDAMPEDVAIDLLGRLLTQLAQAEAAPLSAGCDTGTHLFHLTYEDETTAQQVSDALQRVKDLLIKEAMRERLFRQVTGKMGGKRAHHD